MYAVFGPSPRPIGEGLAKAEVKTERHPGRQVVSESDHRGR